ncbi:TPA: Presumed portal vertex protein [Klebsiella variicola subsp. variicola]|nr:Presumed portal vertex protein [Klebsiella variicola subsp. variicola]
MEAFTFGEPSTVRNRRDILDYAKCVNNGRWFEPPVSFNGLAKSLRAAVHHSSPIYVKRNILASTFIPHPLLSQHEFSRFAPEFLAFGNAFLALRKNVTGRPLKLEASPAKYTRRVIEEDVNWWVPSFDQLHPFAPGFVFHLLEPDINQERYGMPEYLSELNSAWLNEAATLFRRKYYQNVAHAGYIMYVTDAVQSESSTDVEAQRDAMRSSKELGNFKICYSTHHIPFRLMGGKPENIGSLGDIEKLARVFVRNELAPLQERFKEINA